MVWIEINGRNTILVGKLGSPPARVVWIEILALCYFGFCIRSPPARVVWIEIFCSIPVLPYRLLSPPARVVWIEIPVYHPSAISRDVATREGGVD